MIKKLELWDKSTEYYTACLKSVESDKIPEKSGLVRAETILSGSMFESDPNDPSSS